MNSLLRLATTDLADTPFVRVCKVVETETAHRLGCYEGKCANIHGHSYRWEIEVEAPVGFIDGTTDESPTPGIGVDFGDLKAAIKEAVFDVFDHSLVIWDKDPHVASLAVSLNAALHQQRVLVTPWNTTAENYARYALKAVQMLLDRAAGEEEYSPIRVTRVRVWETSNSYAEVQR